MKHLFFFAVILTSCGKPISKSAEVAKLSDSYAKAALLSLLAIESDVSTTEDKNGVQVVSGATQSKIDAADAEASTTQEQAMTALLRQVYEARLKDNWNRNPLERIIDASLELLKVTRSASERTHIEEKVLEDSKKDDEYNAMIGTSEAACFEPLAQALRNRLAVSPETCERWILKSKTPYPKTSSQ
jgi:hypothetical protein